MTIKKSYLKPAIWIVGFIGVIVFVKKLAGAFNTGGIFSDGSAEVYQNTEKRIEDVALSQASMSKTMDAILSIADGLYAAMDDLATDEGAIFSLLDGLNTEDLKAVYKAFGVRSETMFFGVFDVKRGDLFTWFRNELSESDYEKIKVVFSKTGLI